MEHKKDGGPAFPYEITTSEDGRSREWETNEGMSLRDYACIHLRVPETNHGWLNELIRMAQRDELAAKAMQGFWASHTQEGAALDWLDPKGSQASIVARCAYEMADAMLKAREQ